ncbi:MAG: GNAT family N-acetyltransferase, partial [Nitrospiraceae bacterium]
MSPANVHPLYIPPGSQGPTEAGHLILRDGTTAMIRMAQPDDRSALQAFLDRLPPESKRHRFLSQFGPTPELIASLCDASNPHSRLTLIVTRTWERTERIIAAGSYLARNGQTAEIALAVDDVFQGKGIGTLLLERLALTAIRHGFVSLWAVTHAEDGHMRNVFKESGFDLRETQSGGEMAVELSLTPTDAGATRSAIRDRIATTASLRPFFRPRAVAVIGASRDP